MENENLKTSCPDIPSDIQQQEDAALKTCMQFLPMNFSPISGLTDTYLPLARQSWFILI